MRTVSTTKSVDIGEKLVYTGFETQKGLLVLQIVYFLFNMPVVYRPHPLYSMQMRLRMLKLSVGKGRQVIKQLCRRVLQYYTL